MKKLFEKINPRLFKLLASDENASFNSSVLLELYQFIDELSDTNENEKEKVIRKIENIYENIWNLENNRDCRSKAMEFYSKLKADGWIFEEAQKDYSTAVYFNSNAAKIIDVLIDIEQGKKSEYTGVVLAISNGLENIEHDKAYSSIINIIEMINKLANDLKGLRASIYTYYNELIRNKNKDSLNALVDELINKYKRQFFDHAYLTLKKNESYIQKKHYVLRQLEGIMENEEYMKNLANQKLDQMDETYSDFDNCYYSILDMLRDAHRTFDSISKIISDIDEKNTQYLSRLLSKIEFLVNRSDSYKGVLNKIIDSYANNDVDYLNNKFNLVNLRNLNGDSLAKPRANTYKLEVQNILSTYEISNEDLKKEIEDLDVNREYTVENVNKFILQLLDDKNEVLISNCLIDTNVKLIQIILAFIFSLSPQVDYDIKIMPNKIEKMNVVFKDMMLIRR